MSHWDFAGTGQDDLYAEDSAGWPAGSFPAMFRGDRDQEAAPGAEPDDGPAFHGPAFHGPAFHGPAFHGPAFHGGADPDSSRPPGEDWDPGDGRYAGDFLPEPGYAGEGGEDDDDDDEALYPLTYERPSDPADASAPAPAGPEVADGAQDRTEAPAGPGTASGYWAGFGRGEADGIGELGGHGAGAAGANGEAVERERTGRRGQAPPLFGSPGRAAAPPPAPDSPPPPAGPSAPPPAWMDWELGPGQRHHRRRVGRPVLLAAGIAVVAAAVSAVLAAGHPGRPAAAPAVPGRPTAGPAASGGALAAPGAGGTGPGATSPASASPASAPSSSVTASAASSGAASSGAASSASGGASAPGRSAAGAAPLSLAQAQAVVAAYTTANNAANAARSDTALATIETGSSETIDASLFQQGRAAGTAPFPAFGPVRATYYLPRHEPASGPRWFAVQVANAFTANQGTVTSIEYLLFTQQADAGGPWLNTLEPYLLSGASAPPVATGADGLATAVTPDAADAVAPGDLPALTATALDTAGGSRPAVADPGNLADRADQRQWRADVPGSTVTDTHSPASGAVGQEFALLTTGGGALVFYTDAATVTVTPPAGTMLHVTVPGYFSPSQALSHASVDYLEQFAAYDPPAGQGGPGVVADYSAITGKG